LSALISAAIIESFSLYARVYNISILQFIVIESESDCSIKKHIMSSFCYLRQLVSCYSSSSTINGLTRKVAKPLRILIQLQKKRSAILQKLMQWVA